MQVLLDTNVWNSLSLHASANALAAAARRGSVKVLVAPAVVYELIAYRDDDAMRRRLQIVLDERWKRLMPEAFSESRDLANAISVLRPNWLLTAPPRKEAQQLQHDWKPRTKKGHWARLEKEPLQEAERVRGLQKPLLDAARAGTKETREMVRTADLPAWDLPLDHHEETVKDPRPNGDGLISVKQWRLHALRQWSQMLGAFVGQPTPLSGTGGSIDWLSSSIDFRRVKESGSDWLAFWLTEVEASSVPREWVRWGAAFLQAFSKHTNGTPGDNQISSYLLDADAFVSEDKGFCRFAKKLRRDAPFPLAMSCCVPAGDAGTEEVLRRIANRDFIQAD